MAKRKPNIKKLSADEAAFIINLLELIMREGASEGGGIVVGGAPRDFHDSGFYTRRPDLAAKIIDSLVTRRVIVRQYGAAYRRDGYAGRVRNSEELWYTFHPALFQPGGKSFKRDMERLAAELLPFITGRAYSWRDRAFVEYALKWVARALDD
jgi:hypothetical protein